MLQLYEAYILSGLKDVAITLLFRDVSNSYYSSRWSYLPFFLVDANSLTCANLAVVNYSKFLPLAHQKSSLFSFSKLTLLFSSKQTVCSNNSDQFSCSCRIIQCGLCTHFHQHKHQPAL